MKAKKLMRWVVVLSLTGVCAALAVVTLDAWTGRGGSAGPVAKTPIAANALPTVVPAGDPLSAGATGEATAAMIAGSAPGVIPTIPVGVLGAVLPGGDAMLPAAPPLPPGPDRLLEQIETARVGLLAAQSGVPVRPAGRAVWLPVAFLAGGGGLIGCALGLGIGSLRGRKRSSERRPAEKEQASASAPAPDFVTASLDDPADAVVRAARAELAARAGWGRAASPAMSAAPTAEARVLALSRLASAAEQMPSAAPTAVSSVAMPSSGAEIVPARPRRSSFFSINPRRRNAADLPASLEAPGPGQSPGAPRAATEDGVDPVDDFPAPREEVDPIDSRLSALERSLLHVVRAMEEVAERVGERDASSVPPPAAAPGAHRTARVEPGLRRAGELVPRGYVEEDDDLERDDLAPPMRAPHRREREARPRVAGVPPIALPSRPAASVGRAVRALRAVRDQESATPEPWDLAPSTPVGAQPALPVRRERASSVPSASTVDGRDLVRIRRAVLLLAAEGWEGGRIAERLRLGEGDVALILKTAGAEQRPQPAGRGR